MKRTAKQIAQDAVNRMKKTTGQKLFGGVTILNERGGRKAESVEAVTGGDKEAAGVLQAF